MRRRSGQSGFSGLSDVMPAVLLFFCCFAAVIFLGGCGAQDDGYEAPEGTKEFVLTEFYGTSKAGEDYIRKSEKNGLCKDGRLDDKGCIHLYVTDDQRDIWVEQAEKSMKEIEDKASNDDVSYNYSRNYTKLTVSAPPDSDISGIVTILHQALFDAEIYQVFNGNPNWHLNLVVKNSKNDKKLLDVTQPEEGFTIDESMWEDKGST